MVNIDVDHERLADVCRRHHVARLALHGSMLRGEAGPDSDIDLLVRYEPDADPGLLDFEHLRRELSELLGREVDLGDEIALQKHPHNSRSRRILSEARPIYVAEETKSHRS